MHRIVQVWLVEAQVVSVPMN